jgi:hypothetical protein
MLRPKEFLLSSGPNSKIKKLVYDPSPALRLLNAERDINIHPHDKLKISETCIITISITIQVQKLHTCCTCIPAPSHLPRPDYN